MSRTNFKTRRPGWTLIEMLCAMALIALLSMMLVLIIVGTLEIERTQAEGFDRLLQNKALAEQFRADVSAADDAPAQWQQHRADEHHLILHMKTGDHILYAWRGQKLYRQEYTANKSAEVAMGVDGRGLTVEFVAPESAAKLVRLRVHRMHQGKRADGQSLEIAAALGGDWR